MGRRLPVMIGVLAGFGLALGKIPGLYPAAAGLATTAVEIEARVADWVIGLLPSGDWATTGAAAIGLMAPGLTAFGLAVIANSSLQVARVVSSAFMLLGLAAFFYLPGTEAMATMALVGTVVGLASFGLTTILAPIAAGLATMMAVTWLAALFDTLQSGSASGLEWAAEHVAVLHEVMLDGASIGTVRAIALFLAVIPFVAAVSWLWQAAVGGSRPGLR